MNIEKLKEYLKDIIKNALVGSDYDDGQVFVAKDALDFIAEAEKPVENLTDEAAFLKLAREHFENNRFNILSVTRDYGLKLCGIIDRQTKEINGLENSLVASEIKAAERLSENKSLKKERE